MEDGSECSRILEPDLGLPYHISWMAGFRRWRKKPRRSQWISPHRCWKSLGLESPGNRLEFQKSLGDRDSQLHLLKQKEVWESLHSSLPLVTRQVPPCAGDPEYLLDWAKSEKAGTLGITPAGWWGLFAVVCFVSMFFNRLSNHQICGCLELELSNLQNCKNEYMCL